MVINKLCTRHNSHLIRYYDKIIANSVHPLIQMEEDYPSNYSDGKPPILDLNCSMNNEGLIQFEHFEKPTANKMVLSAQSALPMKHKRNIHINECVRRLRNCSQDIEWVEKKKFIQDYVVRLYTLAVWNNLDTM